MTCQNQHKPSGIVTQTRRVLDADDPEDVVDGLERPRAHNHPAVAFSMPDALHEMRAGGEREQNAEEPGSGGRRTEIPPRIQEICAGCGGGQLRARYLGLRTATDRRMFQAS